MKVFIANFGQHNYLWPDCLERSTIATVDNEGAHPFWLAGDRNGYVEYALENLKTVRGETPTKPVASRWFGIMEVISATEGDIWIHREKEELWWTTSLRGSLEVALNPSINPSRDGPKIYEIHKVCEPWSDRTRTGAKLSWGGLHPKAREFLFTEGTLQQLSPDYADYALALIAGDDLEHWHGRSLWAEKVAKSGRNPAVSFGARQRAVWRMADTVKGTVARANGQKVLRTLKWGFIPFA